MLAMGEALGKAISEALKLPEKEQEAIGAWLLAEIESDRRWDELFAESGTVLESMADQTLDEHNRWFDKAARPGPVVKSYTTPAFRGSFASLPRDIRRQARSAYRRFIENPRHPNLRLKRIHGSDRLVSVRFSCAYPGSALTRNTKSC